MASLAVGTGANAAVYSAVDALMFRAPRAIANPARLVDLYTSEGNGGTFGPFSHPDFVSAGAAASLEATAAIEQRAFETTQRPMIYFPMSRATSRGFYAVFRSHSGAETQMDRDVTATLTDLGGPTKLEVLPFETFVSQALAADRLIGTLIGACGAMALGLAVIGVYGVMIDTVRRRRREFGLRAALGATPSDLLPVLLGSSMAPAVAGVGAGIGSAWILSRVVQSVVFGLPPIDATLVAAIVLLMAIVIAGAIIGPARQALRVTPLVALREHP